MNTTHTIIHGVLLSFLDKEALNTDMLFYWSYQKQPPEMLSKKGVLRSFTKFTAKHMCQILFFNKVPGLRPESQAQVFFCEFFKNF